LAKSTASKRTWQLQRDSEAVAAQRMVKKVEALFRLDDSSDEPSLDEQDCEALRVCVRIMTECDFSFRRIPRRAMLTRSSELEYLCDTIRSGMDSFERIKSLASVLRGVRIKRPKTSNISLQEVIAKHASLFERLGSPKLSLAKRLSIVVDAIQLELVFLGVMWW
jgi:hypothetical protein